MYVIVFLMLALYTINTCIYFIIMFLVIQVLAAFRHVLAFIDMYQHVLPMLNTCHVYTITCIKHVLICNDTRRRSLSLQRESPCQMTHQAPRTRRNGH
jgi:hypothetical protein